MPSTVAPWSVYRSTLKRAQNGEFDRASEETKANAISELIRACSSAAGILAFQPFPGLDSAIVTPIHYEMVACIGRIRGYRHGERAIDEQIVGALGSNLLVSHVVMAAAKLVPFVDVFAVSVAYALTCALGEVGDAYFKRGCAMDKREMRACFDASYRMAYEQAYKEKRNELRAVFRDREIRREIRELKKQRRAGSIGAEEVERRIDAILSR